MLFASSKRTVPTIWRTVYCKSMGKYCAMASRPGWCGRNLSTDLRGALTLNVKQHQAAVRAEELPDPLRAIAKHDELGDMQTGLALQLLAQTFVRINELIGAQWVEFALDNALWIIPAARMKMRTGHVIPLRPAGVATMKQNLGFAFVYNAFGVPLAADVLCPFTGWLLSPMIAALAMSLSSVSVISNALRLND